MVKYIEDIFLNNPNLWNTLDVVSDNCCPNIEDKKFINFDEFKLLCKNNLTNRCDTPSSCDVLYFNQRENHIVFIEFKNLEDIENLPKWYKDKQNSIYLKATDSILLLSLYLKKEKSISLDSFEAIKKSFLFVYKAQNSRDKIHRHLNSKLTRYKFIFQNTLSIECDKFLNNWLKV